MKIRTHEVAFEAGRPGEWRAEDLEVALSRNQFQHPLQAEIPGP